MEMQKMSLMNKPCCCLFAVCLTMAVNGAVGDVLGNAHAGRETNATTSVVLPALTQEQAVQNALANNRELAAARVRVEEAKARLMQASLWPNPELELGGRFDSAFGDEGEYGYAATINQPFSIGGRVGARKSVARVQIERVQSDVRDLECRTAAAVRTEFAELFAIQAQAQLQTFMVGLNDGLLAATQQAQGRGQATENDINTLLIVRQQAAQKLARLETQVHSRLLRLNRLMGQPPQYEFIAADESTLPAQSDLSAFTLERALRQRPDFAAAQLDAVLARDEQGLAKAERFEDWRIGVGYEQEHSVVDGAPPQQTDRFVGMKLTIPRPLFDRKQGRIRETIAMEDRTQKTVEALRIQIGQELADAQYRVKMLAPLLESYRDGLLESAEEQLKRIEDGYRSGLSSMADVIQSRRQFNDLKSSYIDTLRDYRFALIDLDSAMGTMEEPAP
jgi:cobalt-zinc-cadmium efflux system outer membrane protein